MLFPVDPQARSKPTPAPSGPLITACLAMIVAVAALHSQDKGDKAEKEPDYSPSSIGKTPLWQLKPFDRLELKDDKKTKIDLDIGRLSPDANFDSIEENNYCGTPGLPWSGTKFRRDLWYQFTSASDGRKYEVIGKGISKIEHYEDIIFNTLTGLMKAGDRDPRVVLFDDCLEYLRILQERTPDVPRLIYARIRFHSLEAAAAEYRQDFERSFQFLLEEKRLYGRVPADARPGPPPEVKNLTPVDERIGALCDRWVGYLVNLRRFGEGRKVIARLETEFPDHAVGVKWRKEYDKRVQPLLQLADQQIGKSFFVEALVTLDQAVDLQPDHVGMRATMARVFEKHPRIRVAVNDLPAYHSGPAGWSPADLRAAELLHEPLVRVKSIDKDGNATFASRLIAGLESSDLNRKALVEVQKGLVWPDGKLVTPVDVQRLFADARQRTGSLYHPAMEFLLTNIQSQPPDRLLVEFDRPQFQAKAWLQLPFLRMGRDPLATESTSGIGWSGLGPYRARERQPTKLLFLANTKYLEPNRPIIKQVVEHKFATPEDRFRALENNEVEMVDFVPWQNLPYVQSLKGAHIVKRGLPTICFLQLNFNREAIRSPDLRRALVYALNRKAILERVGAASDPDVKLLNSPVAVGGFGSNDKINEWINDPITAKVLLKAVEKSLRTIPPLTISHMGNESTRLACQELVKQWRAAGLQLTLVEVNERNPDPREADIRFQAASVSDPIFDLVTVLTRDNPSLFENAGPRLRQLLIQLLQVTNATVARTLLPEIHQALHDEIAIIPLWQWQETFLVSDTLQGLSPSPDKFYQGVTEWKAAPNYPPAFWVAKNVAQLRSLRVPELAEATSPPADRRSIDRLAGPHDVARQGMTP